MAIRLPAASTASPARGIPALAALLLLLGTGHASAAPAPGASLAPVIEEVRPAVVAIEATGGHAPRAERRRGPKGPPGAFRRFLRERGIPMPGDPGRPFGRGAPDRGGSGFFIDADGHIVTNWHIIDGAESVRVHAADGRSFEAEVVGHDPQTDLALLKAEPGAPVPHVAFADSDEVRVGDWVIAIGNPYGFAGTVTTGIVSARGREIGMGPYDDFIQVDAAINRGNSGGPAFDLAGRVIGVNTAIFSPTGASVGIGFAVPSNTVRMVVDDLMEDGRVDRGWIGIRVQGVDGDMALALGLDRPGGALVADVTPGGPADEAGLRAGDVITAVDGRPVKRLRAATRAIAAAAPGTAVRLTLRRDGGEVAVPVRPRAWPEAPLAVDGGEGAPPLGLALGDDGGPGAVVAEVRPGSEAARKGIRPGDRILAVDGEPAADAAGAAALVRQARGGGRQAVLLQVERGGGSRYVALRLRSA